MSIRQTPSAGQSLAGALLIGWIAIAAAGCQVHVAGQTLPSGYYLQDDIQYFAPGPEFKLEREAAALKAARAEEALQKR